MPNNTGIAPIVTCQFVNHSCILIRTPEGDILCDPWFSGNVFNNSWSLLKSTDIENLDLRKLRYIWVSHEHPDHLHFPTLRQVRTATLGQKITFLYRDQPNKNVINELKKIGFDVMELKNETPYKISDRLTFFTSEFRMDTALVVKYDDCTVLNQNDCTLTKKSTDTINRLFPNIDYHFFQFSLAGYYANASDTRRLSAAKAFHIKMTKFYQESFKARIFVPFASFVYFCKPGNAYLNDFRVTVDDLQNIFSETPSFSIPWYLEDTAYREPSVHNVNNLKKWRDLFANSDLKFETEKSLDPATIGTELPAFIDRMTKTTNVLLPGPTQIYLRGLKKILNIDLRRKTYAVVDGTPAQADAEVGDDDFLYALKFPWGADTLNITGNLEIRNQFRWRFFLYTVHARHALFSKPAWVQSAAALVISILRTGQFLFRSEKF